MIELLGSESKPAGGLEFLHKYECAIQCIFLFPWLCLVIYYFRSSCIY